MEKADRWLLRNIDYLLMQSKNGNMNKYMKNVKQFEKESERFMS